jgi:hypothetical protein
MPQQFALQKERQQQSQRFTISYDTISLLLYNKMVRENKTVQDCSCRQEHHHEEEYNMIEKNSPPPLYICILVAWPAVHKNFMLR